LKDRFEIVESWTAGGKLAGVLAEGEPDRLQSLLRDVSGLAGPVLTVQTASPAETAAGGNATLMTIA
jgi:delta 1-pyrroline-5-carboxylate dehydrogenase